MPKPTKSTVTVRDIVFAVLPMDEIKKMSQKDACARFAERATVSQRAFAEMGKLHYAISASLRKGQTIYGELRKLGVKDSTISNASYASKVYDLVNGGHLTEAQYDGFTFSDCHQIVRAMSDRSKLRQTGEEIAALVKAKPDSFDSDLQSIYETGLTVEEAAAQAKAAAEQAKKEAEVKMEKARQDAAAAALKKEREDKEAADRAAADAAAAAAAKAAVTTPVAVGGAEAAKAPANPPVAVPVPVPVPKAESSASAPKAPVAPAPVAATPPASGLEDPEEEETGEPAHASNVTAMPPDPDAALPEVLTFLDELAVTASEFSPEGRKVVFEKLNEMLEIIGETLMPPAKAA